MTKYEIREELRDIKFYFSHKGMFEQASKELGASSVSQKIQKYHDAIRTAPPKLYEIYYSLYLDNNSCESFAEKSGYSTDYIQKLNRKLVKFFEEKFKDEEVEHENS